MSTRQFGERVRRNEDPRLLRGEGRFIDDIKLPGAVEVAFVRSPVARARVLSIDVEDARRAPGVVAVYTCDDLGELDREMPLLIPHPSLTHPKTQRPLARDDVHYVGQTVAMVVAENRYLAEDAADLVEVEYQRLDVKVDLERAIEEGAPLVHDDVPNNVAAHFVQTSGDPGAAFARADHITRVRTVIERSAAAPMECRAVAARWDDVTGELLVYDSTQAPISIRGGLASVFGIDEDKVRVVAPDVGGGFGQKVVFFYPDELLIPMAAMQLNRPVKYIEDRTENLTSSTQERKQVHEMELAATADGEVLGLRDSFLHDTGAFIPYGIAVAQVASTQIAGPYRIPAVRVEFQAVYTPTVPVTPYRGCGRPHACFALERAIDQLADELGLDRFEIRRRNLIAEDEFPYERPGLIFADGLPVTYDSGQYHRALEMLAETIDLEAFQQEQLAARKEGRWIGLGLAFYVEGTGLGPYEGGHVRIHPITGKVYVNTGLSTQGQGHETVYAQIAAEALGARVEDVIVVEGDTAAFDWGVATFASRAAVMSGSAIHKGALKVREQLLEAVSNMLEVDAEDIELSDSKAAVRGAPDRAVTFAEAATASNPLRYAFNEAARRATQFAPAAKHDGPPIPEGGHPGLEATDYYSPPHATWAYGAHVAIIEVDPVTYNVQIRRYVLVHDCGNMINPMLVEGQIAGGVAQGLGGAFYEYVNYDEDGNLSNANFMEFLVPYATEVPELEMRHLETPSPLNPIGVKGVGEAGTIPVAAVVASGVEDALRHLGVAPMLEVPLSPNLIHAAVRRADGAVNQPAASSPSA